MFNTLNYLITNYLITYINNLFPVQLITTKWWLR